VTPPRLTRLSTDTYNRSAAAVSQTSFGDTPSSQTALDAITFRFDGLYLAQYDFKVLQWMNICP
jgi:hypothetical protein